MGKLATSDLSPAHLLVSGTQFLKCASHMYTFTVFTPTANVKDAAAESFKSRRCETITMPYSEIAIYALVLKKKI